MKTRLSPARQAEADALFLELKEQGDDLLREIAALFASKPESQMLGRTEFDLRDLLHRFGAKHSPPPSKSVAKKGAFTKLHRRLGDRRRLPE